MNPAQQVSMYFDKRDEEYTARRKEHIKKAADRVFADPISLALVISEAMDSEPFKFGHALIALKDGDAMQLALLATAAVYDSVTEAM